MIRGESAGPNLEQTKIDNSLPVDFSAITMRADLRRRSQELRISSLNIIQPHATGAMKENYDAISKRVGREANGEEAIEVSADTACK